MSEMKYQKEFEEFVRNNPEFLGGNTLTVQRENYGVSLNTPEYAASYVRFSYEMFCKIKEQLQQELELLKLERDEFKKYSAMWFDKKNELEQELQKTREQLTEAVDVIEKCRRHNYLGGEAFLDRITKQFLEKQDKENKDEK